MSGSKKFDGFLFAKLNLIGSKSEGPIYILQGWDYSEINIVKQVDLWQPDPTLHKFLARKVSIIGELGSKGLVYDEIMDFKSTGVKLSVSLVLEGLKEGDICWVNKMLPVHTQIWQKLGLCLCVKWPYRSIWKGTCPTTQIYDFFIEREGKTIWQWSKDENFLPAATEIEIPGGNAVEYREPWYFTPDEISDEGKYVARGIFIASGQEVTADFEIKFAY